MILPWNTPRLSSSSTDLNTSRLVQSGDGVVGDQRGVGMLAALEQARAADAGDGALAVEAHEQLVAHHRAAGGEQELVEARMRADRRHQASRHAARRAPSPVILT